VVGWRGSVGVRGRPVLRPVLGWPFSPRLRARERERNMPAETVAVASQMPAPKRRNHRPRTRFDARYVLGRRVKLLMGLFCERLGPDADDPVTFAAIMRCAEVAGLAEHHRAKMLRGERVSTETVLRLSRTADMLTRRLFQRKPAQALQAFGKGGRSA
jgi:hypothetical protein